MPTTVPAVSKACQWVTGEEPIPSLAMRRAGIALASWIAAAAFAQIVAVPVAVADAPVVPRPDAPCTPQLANVKTWNLNQSPDAQPFTNLQCQNLGATGYLWKPTPVMLPYTSWLSLGSDTKGEYRAGTMLGVPNENGEYDLHFPSTWIGTPQASDAQCIAEQTPETGGSMLGPPTAKAGGTGRPLVVDVIPNLWQLKLSGHCLWEEASS
jgi:hypothetical protein